MDPNRYNRHGYDRYGRARPAPALKKLKDERWSVRYPNATLYLSLGVAMAIFFSRPIYELFLVATGKIQVVPIEEYREVMKNRKREDF